MNSEKLAKILASGDASKIKELASLIYKNQAELDLLYLKLEDLYK